MKKYYLLLLCLCAVFNLSAVFNVNAAEHSALNAVENTTTELASLKVKMNRAISKFENTNKTLWSYKISRYEDEEGDITSSIEQHSPKENEPWSLKKINGQAPTKKQIKKFVKKKQEQSSTDEKEDSQAENIQLTLRKLINLESLSIVSTDEQHIVMAFDVHIKKLGKDAMGKLKGKLVYQKHKQFIEKIIIWNNTEFSPMFTANITDLVLTFTFVHIDGAVLVKENQMKMKGSFAYFTEINETSLDSFSEYLYQGKAINSEASIKAL